MTAYQYMLTYIVTVPIFAVCDLVWIGYVAPRFYQHYLGHLLGPVQWIPAIVFYVLYIAGIIVFVILPALKSGSWVTAFTLGAFFGLVCYATYDLTNSATVKDWPFIVTMVDLAWGAILTGTVATLSYLVAIRWII